MNEIPARKKMPKQIVEGDKENNSDDASLAPISHHIHEKKSPTLL
jgi:hypothetical protein